MEPTLIAVTLLSLGMAVAMSLVAWRLLREERQRSAARVARLAELASRDAAAEAARTVRPHAGADADLPLRRDVPPAASRPAPAAPVDPLERPLRRAVPAPEPLPAPSRDGAPDSLFEHTETSDGGRRLLVFAAAIVLAVLAVAALVSLGGRRAPADRQTATVATAPLELLSLHHAKEGDSLTVSGLVRNPSEGHDLRRIEAVAFVFDQSGEFIGSGRAPLDFTRLAPGAESPFVIRIDHAGAVGRYRIGFRTEDGGVLGHVDRRASLAAAPERVSSTAEAGLTATANLPR